MRLDEDTESESMGKSIGSNSENCTVGKHDD